jgi:hypothetical protein
MRVFLGTTILIAASSLACVTETPVEIPDGYPELSDKQRAHVVFDLDGQAKEATDDSLGIVFDTKTQSYQLDFDSPILWLQFPSLASGTYTLDDCPGKLKVTYEGTYDSDTCASNGSTFAQVSVAGSVDHDGGTYRYGDFHAMVCWFVEPTTFFTVKGKWSAKVEEL